MSGSACPSEDDLVELAGGTLTLSRASEVRTHVQQCARCHAAVTALSTGSVDRSQPTQRGSTPHLPTAGSHVGRFIVLEGAGGGAMGRVYAAYDTVLHRKVALKFLVSAEDPEKLRSHVEREARALARVAHPNVVAIYEVGSHGPTPFLAMEFIDGVNLRQWLAQQPRSSAQICDAFRQAAEGLLAAHRAGILHRDFKPENVLIGRDGRVRVSDFGLAAEGAGPAHSTTDALVGIEPLSSRASTVAAAGTPAYMAPELWSKQTATAMADVFAFSLALYEALEGRRPFPDQPAAARRSGIEAGAAALGSPVGRPLKDAVLRGLALRPEDRPQSLDPFIKALQPARRRAGAAWAALPLGLLAVGGWRLLDERARVNACGDAGQASTALTRPVSLRSLHGRFAEVLGPGADEAFTALKTRLEAFDVRWATQRRNACLESADPIQRSRAECLDRKLDQLLALQSVLQQATAGSAMASAKAVDTLGDLSECAGRAVAPLVSQPLPRELVAKLDELNAIFETGDYARSFELATQLEPLTRQVANNAFLAQVLIATGRAHNARGDAESARQRFAEAVELAVKAADPIREARGLMLLAAVTAIDLNRYDEALLFLRMSRVAARRAQLPEEIEARTSLIEGRILVSAGRPVPAVAAFERALELWTKAAVPPRYDMVRVRAEMGSALHGVGKREEAVAVLSSALAESETLMGRRHPLLGAWHHNRGLVLLELQQFEAAGQSFQEALAIHAPEGPSRCNHLESATMRALSEGQLGAPHALATIHSLRAELRSSGCSNAQLETSWLAQARLEAKAGAHREARQSVGEAVRAADSTPSIEALVLEATELEASQAPQAGKAWERALSELRKQRGDNHPDAALCLTHLAQLALASGRVAEATELIERAAAQGDANRPLADREATRALQGQLTSRATAVAATPVAAPR